MGGSNANLVSRLFAYLIYIERYTLERKPVLMLIYKREMCPINLLYEGEHFWYLLFFEDVCMSLFLCWDILNLEVLWRNTVYYFILYIIFWNCINSMFKIQQAHDQNKRDNVCLSVCVNVCGLVSVFLPVFLCMYVWMHVRIGPPTSSITCTEVTRSPNYFMT